MSWDGRRSWAYWAFVSILSVFAYGAITAWVSCVAGCSSSQRRAVVHVVADNCERLELPEPVCVLVDDLAPMLAALLLAQREGRDAEVEVRDGTGRSHVFVVPLARIPGAVGSVSRAAIGAADRGSR